METITPDYKIITLGDTNVGKTSIIFRYTSEDYNPNQINTIGMDSKIKTIEIDSQKINLKIWDSAGQERFRSIQRYYYNKVDGVIFVYDITNKKSFSVIDSWIKEVNENINRNISFILVGNKTDLEESREVSIIEGEKFAKEKKSIITTFLFNLFIVYSILINNKTIFSSIYNTIIFIFLTFL